MILKYFLCKDSSDEESVFVWQYKSFCLFMSFSSLPLNALLQLEIKQKLSSVQKIIDIITAIADKKKTSTVYIFVVLCST